MLSAADDYPVHQTPDPIAFAGSDRNFYDRYWFHGYSPDGSVYFGLAFGVYPNVGVADAHFAVMRDGREYAVHASRTLDGDRMRLDVGPVRVIVDEPLQRLRLVVEDETGISADIVFEARSRPVQEPRFTHRHGTRLIYDYTRLTQNGNYSGWIAIDGERIDLGGARGTRDRSWGIRPLGAPDPQPLVPAKERQVFWRWVPLNFEDFSLLFHVNADGEGRVWNSHAVLIPDDPALPLASGKGRIDTPMRAGTRWAERAELRIDLADRGEAVIELAPLNRGFQMRGAGYFAPGWMHGTYKGERVVEREDLVLADLDPLDPANVHVQVPVRATWTGSDGARHTGMGSFEQLIIGPYQPFGMATGHCGYPQSQNDPTIDI
ncbi:hypothetical protein [Sphingomonas sp.]|uniref:hypothetical protein n=1 Tax=Sphingomonas sp. TaxID=28214 RepID=UPI002DD69E26|nr:hypothetical protein [Sphingomonas sp.]